ncbi:MAG: GH116 family glycosyl-hydrolase [Verrucomicrobiia bacterium]
MNTDSNSAGASGSNKGWPRRDFLKLVGLGTAVTTFRPWQAMAGPFTRADFEKLVPRDKRLRPAWVKSLFERGDRAYYRGPDLERIGMPIGGMCAGQVYLGGDGRLWHWDIFNRHIGTGAEHYAKPMTVTAPFAQGFALRITTGASSEARRLERGDWRDVSFNGEYPIGHVAYRDPDSPVAVDLEAFSPFIPLNTEDSSLPVTVMQFTVRNLSQVEVTAQLAGLLENPICLHSGQTRDGFRRYRAARENNLLLLEASAEDAPADPGVTRPDISFDAFEREGHGAWTTTGTAFGSGPVESSAIPEYQGNVGGAGRRVVNSHASAPGGSVEEKDRAKGTLTSKPFVIERKYITFLIGGGAHKGRTCMDLLVDGEAVLSATGANNNRMQPLSWDVRRWAGKTARLRIVDDESGGWGNVGVDDIVFSDRPRLPVGPLAEAPDFGTMTLALLEPQAEDKGMADLASAKDFGGLFDSAQGAPEPSRRPFGERLTGGLVRTLKLAPQQKATVTFLLSWHLPNLKMDRLPPGRHYATRFTSASAVARHVAQHFPRLSSETRLWHDTWYDSTLPYWFLDRTFLNISILATSTCHRFGNGRFWGWEGVGCCHGTCGHVWQYAQALARLFPDLERITRENVDFGLALQPDGAIHFRGEFNNIAAVDGQAGTILRALREHQMSADDAFLKRNWPNVKRATQWLIAKDEDGDGLITGNQHNTLDTDWFGPVAWLSGLYLAALRAADTMAREVGDTDFARQCQGILEKGRTGLVRELFDGEYFINKPDPKHLDAINSGTGCHIDQVMGQGWAFQVGLPRVLPEAETRAALRALWLYNFTPDVGPYRAAYKPGRWYAMPGEAGLLMCTFPRSDWDYEQAKGKGPDWAAGYFNECMNGFEYQVASHMVWEGMIQEGLAITRAVHDRYHPSRRNPWNEVECGDHYARSMASYGVFLAACGFACHGPLGQMSFAPRLTPGEFKAAFTGPEGWGTYTQKQTGTGFRATLEVKWGNQRLQTLTLTPPEMLEPTAVAVTAGGRPVTAKLAVNEGRVEIQFTEPVVLQRGDKLEVALG